VSSNPSACDMWMAKVTSGVEQLDSIIAELNGVYRIIPTPSMASVTISLKDLRNELLSVLSSHQRVHTTGQLGCGPTNSNPISSDTLEAIEVGALVLVEAMKILAQAEGAPSLSNLKSQNEYKPEEELDEISKYFDHNDDGNCPYCVPRQQRDEPVPVSCYEDGKCFCGNPQCPGPYFRSQF